MDLTGSGLEPILYSRKLFTKEAGKVNLQAFTFNCEADTFDLTDSSLDTDDEGVAALLHLTVDDSDDGDGFAALAVRDSVRFRTSASAFITP